MQAGPDAHHNASELLDGQPGREYHESAFLYFLAVEQARAELAAQALRLLLVSLEPDAGTPLPIGPGVAARLFTALRQSLRETDIIGWYRQDRVLGAVLNERADGPAAEVARVVQERVGQAARHRLPERMVRGLRMRVVHLRPRFGYE